MTEEAVREMAKGMKDPILPLLVLLLEKVFLLVSAVIRALMVPDVASCDTTLGNAVRKLLILMQSHAVNINLEHRSRK